MFETPQVEYVEVDNQLQKGITPLPGDVTNELTLTTMANTALNAPFNNGQLM